MKEGAPRQYFGEGGTSSEKDAKHGDAKHKKLVSGIKKAAGRAILGGTLLAGGTSAVEKTTPEAKAGGYNGPAYAGIAGEAVRDVLIHKQREKEIEATKDTINKQTKAQEEINRRREETERQEKIIREAGEQGWKKANVDTTEGKTSIEIEQYGSTKEERMQDSEHKFQLKQQEREFIQKNIEDGRQTFNDGENHYFVMKGKGGKPKILKQVGAGPITEIQ